MLLLVPQVPEQKISQRECTDILFAEMKELAKKCFPFLDNIKHLSKI